MLDRKLFGIDFSGNADKWTSGCTRSNVWLAEGRQCGPGVRVERLVRVQNLEGSAHPFDKLSDHIARSTAVVAIDAPFSIPASCFDGDAKALWRRVAGLPKDGRPFVKGAQLIAMVAPSLDPRGKKILRETEVAWQKRGINVRSTLWSKPRGGAPFAAAVMTLLARHEGAVWPFSSLQQSGPTLVEAFPAAQLNHWGIPFTKYGKEGQDHAPTRITIVDQLQGRGLILDPQQRRECVEYPDALDAAICLFAARAIAANRLYDALPEIAEVEGFIAVHE